MESEFREKLNIDESKSPVDAGQQASQSGASEGVRSSGDTLDDFDNQKLQEQLNMQIQSNQEHLQFSQQVQLSPQRLNPQALSQQALGPQALPALNQSVAPNLSQQNLNQQNPSNSQPPQILQQQLNPQLYNQISQKFVQLQQAQNQPPSTEDLPIQSNASIERPEAKPIHNVSLADSQVARIQSPIAFDPSAYLPSWCKKDLFNRVADTAVNGFNSVLITLDPQMKELLKEGGPSVLVTCKHPFDVASIRDGFLDVFKRATVKSRFKFEGFIYFPSKLCKTTLLIMTQSTCRYRSFQFGRDRRSTGRLSNGAQNQLGTSERTAREYQHRTL